MMIPPQRHNAAIAAGILMIGLVCFSRVYLGVHYVSDVLSGILEAIAWSTLALTALRLAHGSRRQAEKSVGFPRISQAASSRLELRQKSGWPNPPRSLRRYAVPLS